jgi:nitrogen fixation/metabolism regulation signal transduction histidine kinase
MRKGLLYGGWVLLLAVLVTMVAWQGSFSMEWYSPQTAKETYLLWAVSILIFLLMVTLGFMLVRTFVRLYIERRTNREGSRIRTKLMLGALALTIMPVFFQVLFSIYVLTNNMTRWFSRPAQNIEHNLVEANLAFERETQRRAEAQARWLAGLPELADYIRSGKRPTLFTPRFCRDNDIYAADLRPAEGAILPICAAGPGLVQGALKVMTASVPTAEGATLVVQARMTEDLAARQIVIEDEVHNYQQLESHRKETRNAYLLLLLLITLFILFVATWMARVLAEQISRPIAALLAAVDQLRHGHLEYRVETRADDELATLVRTFNEMAVELEGNERELERRRQFTEAILESIPTGVISLTADRRIQRVNSALVEMFGAERTARANCLEDLVGIEHAKEIHYLLNRARRTGEASSRMELQRDRQTLHISVTVAALAGLKTEGGESPDSGWVVVLEDTSELLRAQKAEAWHEVARRIAHEMKNPLTPIALSAERIARQLDKAGASPDGLTAEMRRIVGQCSRTISAEVQSVKTLVDEFSRFARFPAAQPVPAELNGIVEQALAVFADRLDGIRLEVALAAGLPPVNVDPEQFKRVVVNLVDNAAEAVQGAPRRSIEVTTRAAAADSVELVVADTGHGIEPEDRDRLFLPYFSTKGRGTGLGLAIVHHILQEHGAQIRVEDNQPRGARFVIEIPAVPVEAESRAVAGTV